MRSPTAWGELLWIEPGFRDLERAIAAGTVSDYRQVPPRAFAWHGWDLIPEERLFRIALPFLRQQLARARAVMPEIYGPRLAGIDPGSISSLEDWHHLPVLVKDDDPGHGLPGFRDLANQNPLFLRPRDTGAAAMAFGSGGSSGRYTPTFVTQDDRDREIHGWRRGHDYHGLVSGDTALYTYNTTHKGGQWMQESLWVHGVNVCVRRPEEGPLEVLENLRRFAANVLFTVQPPFEQQSQATKSGGITLFALLQASLENPEYEGLLIPGPDGSRQVQFLFLGGFEIVPDALELVETYLGGLPVATLLGSSEAIPQACSTHPGLTPRGLCHHNHLHLLHGPHYIEILKPDGADWVPVAKGEEGLLVYTSFARDGTLWLRYAPGDLATRLLDEGECPCGLRSPVIAGVHRRDMRERDDLFIAGCAAG
jgi:phenylacetate-coenzyme A ligase PaaK-like adenylate-forming protein